jgi:lipopolysaccharide transport system ATP-binding protein
MNDIAIRVENLSKAYRLGVRDERSDTFAGAALNLLKVPIRNFRRLKALNTFTSRKDTESILWALKNVSFEIKNGEVVGFVGPNGAGKSTLLKILCRITEPNEGCVEIFGRISSLLEVGTGFHPELTGRENIYMNGTILGMKKAEINRKFDEIVDFSGVERFLDTPVKRYSSGMRVRLAFAVAAHLEPEILIIDEVLAVGDAEFQKKCLNKMENVAGSGRTVLFVSHNMGAVQNLCSRAVALQNGKMVDDGPVNEVVERYLNSFISSYTDAFSLDNPERQCSGQLWLTQGCILNSRNQATDVIISGEPIAVRFKYEAVQDVNELTLVFTVYNESGVAVTSINTGLTGLNILSPGKRGTLTCTIPKNPFPIGNYRLAVAVLSNGKKLDHISRALIFTVSGSIFFQSSIVPQRQYCTAYVDHKWSFESGAESKSIYN